MRNMETIIEAIKTPKRTNPRDVTHGTQYDRFTVCTTRKGIAFLVDNDVAEYIMNRTWCIDTGGYLCANVNGVIVRLHDVVMALSGVEKPSGYFVDHINQDKLDNRRNNLRFVSPQENSRNLPIKSDNTSGYTGVSQTKNGRYRAYITVNKKRLEPGYYGTANEARQARQEAEDRFGFLTRPQTIKDKCNIAFLCEMEDET